MDKEIKELSVFSLAEKIKQRELTSQQVTEYYLSNIKRYAHKNAVLEVFDDALENAKIIDKRLENKEDVGKLAGVPVIIKDNMLYKGHKCTCASHFLENYVSQYTATAVKKLLDEGAVILGRANMDEFAMGASCEHSAYGPCLNAYNDEYVSGGSSGGSAVAVALDMCAFALGSDTGGSIRQPSSFNGVVGLKPSYGAVSRYGLVAFASSLDQIGPITKSVEDAAFVLNIIAGKDENDQTSKSTLEDLSKSEITSLEGLTIGLIKQVEEINKNSKYLKEYEQAKKKIEDAKAKFVQIDMPKFELSLPAYYIIAPAEATSNLGRFDGVKYTTRAEDAININELYKKSRTRGFGSEVKRRIMLGNFALSSGYFDAYYKNAKRVQKLIKTEFEKAFSKVDAILLPTSFNGAFKIGEKVQDPVAMYNEDMFTIFANLASVPVISIPFGKTEKGLPLGLQVVGGYFKDESLLKIAKLVEKELKK